MFGFGKESSVVEVNFYEGENKTPFAVSNMPVDQLPDTFELDTTLHLGDEDWRVIGAQPAEKENFKKSGKLNLYLVKSTITKMDPNALLYSLPTINNDIAAVESADSMSNIAVLREDDWRQFEFIDQQNESLIEKEFSDIQGIYDNHGDGVGFKELHLRKRILTPIKNSSLNINSLKSSFPITHEYDGVAFNMAGKNLKWFCISNKIGLVIVGANR